MKEDTLRKLITVFFKYLWLVCGTLILINFCSMLLTTCDLVRDKTENALDSLATDLSRSVSVNYDLLDGIKNIPLMGDTSIPVQDRAASLRSFVAPFQLWMIGVVDPDGMISSTLRHKSAKVARDYIPRIVQSKEREMTDVFPAGATGELNYTLLMPVEREGKVVSIVFVSTKLSQLDTVLRSKAYESKGYFLMLDSELNILAHPWKPLMAQSMIQLTEQETMLGLLTREEVQTALKNRDRGTFISLFQGTLYYTAFTPLEETPWTLIHRVRLLPTLSAAFVGFFMQAGVYLIVFGILYFFGNAYILRHLEPVDSLLKQVIVLNRVIHDSDIMTEQDAETLLNLSKKGLKDELTGLPTRMLFRQLLNVRMQKGFAEGMCAIFYIDMDNLKDINDDFGHRYGDQAIQRFGEGLYAISAEIGGLCSRYGGDEFLLFVEGLQSSEAAVAIAVKVQRTLRGALEKDGEVRSFQSSVGISLYPLHTSNIDMAIQLADIALYETKQRGKGGYTLYSPDAQPPAKSSGKGAASPLWAACGLVAAGEWL